MPFGLATATLVAVLFVVFVGGVVKGVAGFGYAIASTALLATFLAPSVAVVVMILPMLVGNLALVTEVDRADLPDCVRRFWPYVLASLLGTLVGMALMEPIPAPLLSLLLGLFTLSYVVARQDAVSLPGAGWVAERCFTTAPSAKAGLGLASGVVFGASNVGVQFVAYLDALSLDRQTFVGVLSMILVGVSTVRVAAAWTLGLYGADGVLAASVLAVVPGLVGVRLGGVVRSRVPDRYQRAGVFVLLAVIGARLSHGGLTGL